MVYPLAYGDNSKTLPDIRKETEETNVIWNDFPLFVIRTIPYYRKTIALFSLLLLPATALAVRVEDPQHLTCLREVYTNEAEGEAEAEEQFHRAYELVLQAYVQDISQAWTIMDKDDRRDALRATDKDFREAKGDARSERNDTLKEVRSEKRDALRACSDAARQRRDLEDDRENNLRDQSL